ncbi:KTSC domain-containing protein [Photobacterium toruni]|uniref:KTSC domain-containing protein n=1 Tax=Photobacterium toruni TaxID=1935446 RepID=UPI00210F7108|nr:KTSC domain-containing protein [Photobacterium toruni]
MIDWVIVSSDLIKKIGHDVTNDCLYIDFSQRDEYEVYANVSLYSFYHFSLATSIDEYYQQVIRSSYSLKH